MYLSANLYPDIALAVHQCAQFSFCPWQSHKDAVKQIVQYLKGTKDNGLLFQPTDNFQLDCYVDTNFAGLCHYEDDQELVCVKSGTGYVLIFVGCRLPLDVGK